jgi:predicted nucleic acid-binding protein
MIIPDTSVWVDHFRGAATLLSTPPARHVRRLLHPFVYGELLLGGLSGHEEHLIELRDLRQAPVAETDEVADFIDWAELAGTGIGYVDTHLLISARMVRNGRLLTLDKRLNAQAERLGVAYQP